MPLKEEEGSGHGLVLRNSQHSFDRDKFTAVCVTSPYQANDTFSQALYNKLVTQLIRAHRGFLGIPFGMAEHLWPSRSSQVKVANLRSGTSMVRTSGEALTIDMLIYVDP